MNKEGLSREEELKGRHSFKYPSPLIPLLPSPPSPPLSLAKINDKRATKKLDRKDKMTD